MNLEDILLPAKAIKTEKWQLGNIISNEIQENGIVLIFCSDYRGIENGAAEILDFKQVRKELYQLSKLDFEVPVCDLGDLISGRSHQDTHYVLQEVLSMCHQKNAIPVVVGGSNDLAFSLFSALSFHQKNSNYTQISNLVSLSNEGEELTEKNFLSKILSSKTFDIKNYHHLGYQKHLNEMDSVKLMKEVDFDVVRLAELMNSTEKTEPFFRRADLVTLNCDAVESLGDGFSVNPQVNGLNKREICAYMKETGLSQNLKSAGIFNYNANSRYFLNHQLLAQMIWHLIEGINIQKSHPVERTFETFWLMIDDRKYAFQRETFSDLWYFGDEEKEENLIPCSLSDYEAAKRGMINPRFLRN
ncbi:formimidoylglutamase [Chryseobacterium gotjawalense]|uniref:Formimidoylglutamase n=1 Tax=Chryseobacterium gotjawalense TaxID=3042315 RepID=A0ABY8RBZ2_9FLAO|nr:formimidoylglutamase [Chryseobacterium sp. wdc7]WHF50559.1 formimidoylglutamase [Chryseobacterium sp. wdc7]